MAKVPFKVSFSIYPDETSLLSDLVLPDDHSLESWGDAEAGKGTISLQQPAMDPVYSSTRATADVLIQLAQRDVASGNTRVASRATNRSGPSKAPAIAESTTSGSSTLPARAAPWRAAVSSTSAITDEISETSADSRRRRASACPTSSARYARRMTLVSQ